MPEEHDLDYWEAVEEGVEWLREGLRAEAKEALNAVLARDAANYYAHCYLGHIAFQHEHFPEALAYYLKALELNPAFLSAYLGAGWSFRHIGRSAEAIRLAHEGLRRHPEHPDLVYLLGTTHAARDEPEAAEFFLRRWRELDNDPEKASVVDALLKPGADPQA